LWTTEEHGHGPLIFITVLWLFWQRRDALRSPSEMIPPDTTKHGSAVTDNAANLCYRESDEGRVRIQDKSCGTGSDTPTYPIFGSLVLGFGLLLYVVGRSQDIIIFELGSQIPVLVGTLLITHGFKTVRILWFALFFIIFMLPLPGFLVDAVTGPLKQQVSVLTESILYAVGYPIARSGVMLEIGPYQLLVADACSGLNSMFSLSALGILYLYLEQHTGILQNSIIVLSILPIAFIANVLRVIALVLITYYLGDEAGQGFLHGFAGIVLFVSALSCLLLLDWLLGRVLQS
jgi:exosortase B